MIPERLQKPMPKAPRLHWGWVLVLQLLTRGLFSLAWLIVQANWVRRVNGKSKAFWWAIASAAYLPASFLLIMIELAVGVEQTAIFNLIAGAAVLFVAVVLWTLFTLHRELERAPISMSLSWAGTLFLGVIYFQYHLHDYDVEGKAVPEGSLGLSASSPIIS